MTEQLLAGTENSAGSECQVYERRQCDFPTTCQPAGAFGSQEAKWDAVIRDISVGGIRIVLRRRFEPGSGLAIELPTTGGHERYTVFAKVVHLEPQPGGHWALGCRFVSELSEEELDRLLPSLLQGSDSAQPELCDANIRLEIFDGTRIDFVVRRLSATSWPLPPGKVVTMRGGDPQARWSLRVEVLNCTPKGSDWTVDCRLADAPTTAHLLRALGNLQAAGR